MGRVDEVDVGFTTLTIGDRYLNSSYSITWIFDHFASGTRLRELACQDLNFNYSERETVNLVGVDGRISEGLWRHVDQGPWTRGVGGQAWVDTEELGHTEVGDLGSAASNQQDIVAGEVAMDDVIGVEVIQSQGYVVAQGDLDMVGQRLLGSLEKTGEAFIHKFHQQHREARVRILGGPEVLDYVGVLHRVEEVALLLEPAPGRPHPGAAVLEEDGVQEFGCTGEQVAHGFTDGSVGPSAEGVSFKQSDVAKVKLVRLRLTVHGSPTVGNEPNKCEHHFIMHTHKTHSTCTYTCRYTRIHAYMYTHICTHRCPPTRTRLRTRIRQQVHIYTHTDLRIHTHTHTHTHNSFTHTHTPTHTHTQSLYSSPIPSSRGIGEGPGGTISYLTNVFSIAKFSYCPSAK